MTEPRDYFDLQVVEVHFVPVMPGQRPDEIWFAVPHPASEEQAPPARNEIERDLLHHFVEGHTKAEGWSPPYSLEARSSYLSWGADGANLSVVLITASAVAGAVPNDLWSGFRAWLRERGDDHEVDISDENAEGHARWRVEASFGVSIDDLKLLAEERRPADREWTFTFAAPRGERFEVEVAREGRGLVTGRIRRATEHSDDEPHQDQ